MDGREDEEVVESQKGQKEVKLVESKGFQHGEIVWAKARGNYPFWPARIIDPKSQYMPPYLKVSKKFPFAVIYYGDGTYAALPSKSIIKYSIDGDQDYNLRNKQTMSNKYLTTFPAAVKQADLDILRPEGMRLPMPDQFPESDEITPKKFTKSTKPKKTIDPNSDHDSIEDLEIDAKDDLGLLDITGDDLLDFPEEGDKMDDEGQSVKKNLPNKSRKSESNGKKRKNYYEGEEEEEEEEEEYNDDDSNEKSAKKAAKRKLSVSNEDAPVKRKAGRPRKVQPAEGSAEKPPKKQKDVSQATSASSSAKSSSSEVPPPVASAAAALETSEERKDEKKAVVVKEPPAAAKVDFHQETRQERLVRLVKNLTIAIEKTVDDAAALKIMDKIFEMNLGITEFEVGDVAKYVSSLRKNSCREIREKARSMRQHWIQMMPAAAAATTPAAAVAAATAPVVPTPAASVAPPAPPAADPQPIQQESRRPDDGEDDEEDIPRIRHIRRAIAVKRESTPINGEHGDNSQPPSSPSRKAAASVASSSSGSSSGSVKEVVKAVPVKVEDFASLSKTALSKEVLESTVRLRAVRLLFGVLLNIEAAARIEEAVLEITDGKINRYFECISRFSALLKRQDKSDIKKNLLALSTGNCETAERKNQIETILRKTFDFVCVT